MIIEGHQRVTINNVKPELDCGKTQVKRIINETLEITADIFSDGHDKVEASLLYREKTKEGHSPDSWNEIPMEFNENDRWSATLKSNKTGILEYTIEAWVDHFATWQYGLKKKI